LYAIRTRPAGKQPEICVFWLGRDTIVYNNQFVNPLNAGFRRNVFEVTTASNRAYELIRAKILDGSFAGGEHLKESDLTDLCGTSRTPIREALRRLALGGLVVFTPHTGARVAEMDVDEIGEIYALRAMIEGHAAHRAATRLPDADLRRCAVMAADCQSRSASMVSIAPASLSASLTKSATVL